MPHPIDERVPVLAPLCQGFGVVFCAVWAAAVVAFPAFKGVPLGYAPIAAGLLLAGVVALPPVWRRVGGWPARVGGGPLLVGLVAAGFGLRLLAVFAFPVEPLNDDLQFHTYAANMLRGEPYGSPAQRAFFPPGMSFLLTAWYAVAGPSPLAGKVLNALIGTAMIPLTYVLARRVVPEPGARWAAVVTAVLPTLVIYAASMGYELALGCLLVGVCELALRLADGGRHRLALAAAIGLLLGFGTLIKPTTLLIPGVLLVAWGVLGVGWRAVGYAAVAAAVMAAVVAPWTWRNYQVFGEFVPVSTNGGVVLYGANHPGADGGAGVHVAPLPGEHDEVSRDRLRQAAAVAWMKANPGPFARLVLQRQCYVWGTSSSILSVVSYDRIPAWQEDGYKALINVAWTMLLAGCVAATVRTDVWRRRAFVPMLLLLAYVFTVHLFYEGISRHHIPLIPVLILVAAAGLVPAEEVHDGRG